MLVLGVPLVGLDDALQSVESVVGIAETVASLSRRRTRRRRGRGPLGIAVDVLFVVVDLLAVESPRTAPGDGVIDETAICQS